MTSMSTKIRDMVARAELRGHVIRNIEDGEPCAPGVFALCGECNATLRWYNGRPIGGASQTWCPEAPVGMKQGGTNMAHVDMVSVYDTKPTQQQTEDNATLLAQRFDECGTATINWWATTLNQWAQSKGWNDKPLQLDGLIALMHSELSEALEEWRNGHEPVEIYFVKDKDGRDKPEGVPVELIDCVIRILHTLDYFGVDVEHVMALKHEYNITRAYRHGGKRA